MSLKEKLLEIDDIELLQYVPQNFRSVLKAKKLPKTELLNVINNSIELIKNPNFRTKTQRKDSQGKPIFAVPRVCYALHPNFGSTHYAVTLKYKGEIVNIDNDPKYVSIKVPIDPKDKMIQVLSYLRDWVYAGNADDQLETITKMNEAKREEKERSKARKDRKEKGN